MKALPAFGACAAIVALAWLGAHAQGDDSRVAAGKKLTTDTCANDHCHGGSATSFDDMKGITDARIRKAIAEGMADAGMPPFRGVFTDDQIDSIVAYVLAVSHESSAPEMVAAHTRRR